MSTRAVYSFIDDSHIYHVYKHHDGYLSGACDAIEAATSNAWKLPRFEPDEFGAAFIAANKDSAGGIRLTNGPDEHGDLAYRYEVRAATDALHVTAYEVGTAEPIFAGSLEGFKAFAAQSRFT